MKKSAEYKISIPSHVFALHLKRLCVSIACRAVASEDGQCDPGMMQTDKANPT